MAPVSASARLSLFVGLRYSFSRQRNRFIGVVSAVCLLGMALGVASLITVLSVMNGFAGELRDRILSLVPHVTVEFAAGIEDWPATAARLTAHPQVLAAAPYIDSKVLLGGEDRVRGALLTAVDVGSEPAVSEVASHMVGGSFEALDEVPYGIVVGALQARALGVSVGDRVEVTVPRLTHTPLGSFPRRKRFTVVGIFEVGAQLDSSHAYTSLASGRRVFAADRVEGLRLRLADLFDAPRVARQLAQEMAGYQVRDWGQSQGSLFAAVRMEKVMMTALLMSVIAVAAFNIVSTLVMAVTDKRGDIAVLRTMGARAGSVMSIFMAQGMILSCTGILVGGLLGVALALNIAELTLMLEELLGGKLFNPRVFFISNLPSRLQWSDVAVVTGSALALSLLATVYPAWRATRVAPAEVLRYE